VVTDSLIDYLSSYSGVKKLDLKVNGFLDQEASDEAAGKFFNRALPRHAENLEVMNLEARYESAWCYSTHNSMLIQKCVKLRYLSLGLFSKQVRKIVFSAEDDAVVSDLSAIITTAMVHMPDIQQLSLCTATPETYRTLFFSNSGDEHAAITVRTMHRTVKKFMLDGSMSHYLRGRLLPRLRLVSRKASEVFVYGHYRDRNGVYKYEPVPE
jgi:hypothetical protein